MAKVTELINNKEQISYSFEVTPNVSVEEIEALGVDPTFYSVTWHASSHQCKDLNINSIATAKNLAKKQKHVLLHVSCDLMIANYLKELLSELQENNICNLFVILGDNFDPKTSEFGNTSELIKFIKKHTGNYFCIGVAGYPCCSDEKLTHLKEKIESGADFIITQAFFEVNTYKDFVERCIRFDIKVPIIPGVFPFESYKQLRGFAKICNIKIADDLFKYVKDMPQFNNSCLEIFKRLIVDLKLVCHVSHFHFFTLNKLQSLNKLIQEERLLE